MTINTSCIADVLLTKVKISCIIGLKLKHLISSYLLVVFLTCPVYVQCDTFSDTQLIPLINNLIKMNIINTVHMFNCSTSSLPH